MTTVTLFIHIGASKTATTTLQENVFAQLPDAVFIGKPFPHERAGGRPLMSEPQSRRLSQIVFDIVNAPGERFSIEAAAADVRAIMNAIGPADGPIILSEEAFANDACVPISVLAGRLRDVFGPANILLTTRNQFTALPSLYLHKMRKGTLDLSFDKWLECAFADPAAFARSNYGESLDQYRYASLLEAYRSAFPDGKIGVFLYEELVADRASFGLRLGEFLGVAPERIGSMLEAPPQNSAKSESYIRYQRTVQRYARIKNAIAPRLDLARSMPIVAALKDWIKSGLAQAAAKGGQISVEMSAGNREKIVAYYGGDNRSLASSYGIDLRPAAYPGLS